MRNKSVSQSRGGGRSSSSNRNKYDGTQRGEKPAGGPRREGDRGPARGKPVRKDFAPRGGVPTGETYARVEFPKYWRTVIGFHAIREVLAVRPKSIEAVWIKQGWEGSTELKELHQELKQKNLKIEEKPPGLLDKVMPSHQGAAVFVGITPEMNWSEIEQSEVAKVLVLDGIEDPHNLGAILRTAWLMGVSGALTPDDRSASLTSTVHKVACGGVEHVPVERTTNFANPLEDLKKQGFWVFGLSHEGKRSLFDLKIPEKVVWCIGSEDRGLRTTTERLCDELIRIPQLSDAASYNASVATAIALTETLRQQTSKK